MKRNPEIRSIEGFDTALQQLYKEMVGFSPKICLSSVIHDNLEEQQRRYFEIRDEFCNRYGFTKELFNLAWKASSAKTLVNFVEDILNNREYRKQCDI
jgi:5,10-methylene-tetrahydrofolate dehydrogenase/methenyl tetrahydrofolate cyclohydrolase